MALELRRGSTDSEILVSWWKGLHADPGGRAGLKRCHDLTEVFFQPAFHELRRRLGASLDNAQSDGLAAVAALLSHVKAESGVSLAAQMAKPMIGEKSPMSELRFRRLLQCQTRAELFPLLLRAIRILDGLVNLPSLIESVFYWNESTRRRWAMDYYSVLPNTSTK